MASFSNQDLEIIFLDYVTAPGVNIFFTNCSKPIGYAFYSSGPLMKLRMQVAGIAALLKSYEEGLTAKEIENLISRFIGLNNKLLSFCILFGHKNNFFEVLEIHPL